MDHIYEPGVLWFNVGEARRLIDFSLTAPRRKANFAQAFDPRFAKDGVESDRLSLGDDGLLLHPLKPDEIDGSLIPAGLWLVKDSGCYLMSNAADLPVDASTGSLPVAYARGLDSKADADDLRYVCGGDDFCEFVEADPQLVEFLRKGDAADAFRIGLDDSEILIQDCHSSEIETLRPAERQRMTG